MNRLRVAILLGLCLLGLVILGAWYGIAGNKYSLLPWTTEQPTKSQRLQSSLSDFLGATINFAHEGYLGDQSTKGTDSSDIAALMAAMIEEIDHEKQAVSFIAPYASSSNSNISSAASLLAVSETNVILKQEQGLEVMRQLSNGNIPTDAQYALAQIQAAQNERGDNMVLAFDFFPALTMNTDSIAASSTATIGPLNPSNALSDTEKSTLLTSIQMDFGDTLDTNENDVFLLLAQEIDLLLTSPSYSDFHSAWIAKVSNVSR